MLPITNVKPKQGHLLISEPFLNDPYFKRSVVLLAEHSSKGSMGFILNKPIDLKLNDAIWELPFFDTNLFFGGPVGKDTVHFIHTLGERIADSMKIMDGLYWGGSFESLKSVIAEGKVARHELRFFIGYSGWEPRQLDMELKTNSWIVVPAKIKQVMEGNAPSLWRDILKGMGSEFSVMSNFPEDPSYN